MSTDTVDRVEQLTRERDDAIRHSVELQRERTALRSQLERLLKTKKRLTGAGFTGLTEPEQATARAWILQAAPDADWDQILEIVYDLQTDELDVTVARLNANGGRYIDHEHEIASRTITVPNSGRPPWLTDA
jgi:hypothetical protein